MIIIQGFDANKIIGGASGYLRQEFRELELLDKITKLLPDHIYSTQHNVIIQQIQAWKGTTYILKNVLSAICWKHSDFMFMQNAVFCVYITNTAFFPSHLNKLELLKSLK